MENNNDRLININTELDEAQKNLVEKGISQREINYILSLYDEFIHLNNDNNDKYIKQNYYSESSSFSSEKVKGVNFGTKNEVRLLHCLYNINPNVNVDHLGKMVGMIYHILGVKTEWYTIPEPNKK